MNEASQMEIRRTSLADIVIKAIVAHLNDDPFVNTEQYQARSRELISLLAEDIIRHKQDNP